MTIADTEVRWHQKRIDLAFISPMVDIECVAIELKIDNWASALRQSHLNQLLTASSWIAAPSVTAMQDRRARSLGVGVLLVTTRGVYPLLYPRKATGRHEILVDTLTTSGRRFRDLLGETLHVS